MNRRGQAATEYLVTYGWAILVVVTATIVLWQMGFLDFESEIAPARSGFSVLLPQEWKVSRTGGSCNLIVVFLNGAGEGIKSVNMIGGTCSPTTVDAGESTYCEKSLSSCREEGKAFEEDVVVTYQRLSNQSFQTAGTVWGNIE